MTMMTVIMITMMMTTMTITTTTDGAAGGTVGAGIGYCITLLTWRMTSWINIAGQMDVEVN